MYLTVCSVYLTVICSDSFLCVATKPVFLLSLQKFGEWQLEGSYNVRGGGGASVVRY